MRGYIAILLLVLSAAAQQTESPQASIEGIVVNAQTSEPIAGATLRLVANIGVETFTDDKGVFSLGRLTPGRSQFRVDATGHLGQTLFIDLAVGERRNGISVLLSQTGVISGRVVDSNGKPIPGILPQTLVYTHSFPGSNSSVMAKSDQLDAILHPLQLGRSVGTDDRGEFRIYNLPPGEYQLRIAPGNNPVLGAVLYPGVVDLTKALPIRVKGGEEVHLSDVVLTPSTLGWITAHITNATGEAVTAPLDNLYLARNDGSSIDATLKTGGVAGSLPAIRPDAPGRYNVCTTIPIQRGFEGYARKCHTVDYSGAEMDLDFTVTKPEGIFSGRILIAEQNGNTVVSSQEISIATDIIDMYGAPLRVTKKSDGSFAATGLYPGLGRITGLRGFVGQGNPNIYLASAHQRERDVLVDGITLSNQDSNVEIQVSLLGGVARGKVMDADGNRVPNATIALVPQGDLAKRTDKADTYRTGQSDIDGVYEIRGIIPGSYRAYAAPRPEGWAYWDAEYMKKFDANGKALQIEKGGSASADLTVVEINSGTEGTVP